MEVTSDRKSSYSMGTKGICLLVVHDDLTCRNIVAEMLQSCTYEVLHVGRPLETLGAVCNRKDTINLILTNLHRIQGQVPGDILHHIEKKLNLPTFLMSPDEQTFELKDQESSFAAYFLSSLNVSDVDHLWEFASVTAIEDKRYAAESKGEGSGQMASTSENVNLEATGRENTPSNGDQPRKYRKRKRKKMKGEKSGASGDSENVEKRPRMIWTDELHMKFLEAMEMILPEKPVPKRIVEVMNVPWLKREHVASHLQKYRIILKKAGVSNFGMNLTNHVGESSITSWRSSLYFSSLQRNPNLRSMLYGNGKAPFHQSPLGIKSISASRNLHLYSSDSRLSSSTMSILRPSNMLAGNNNQGTLQQSSNSILSSSIQALMSQKNSYLDYAANSLSNDWWRRFLERQLKNGPRSIFNNGFGLYGDQTKNMLFSVQGSSSTSDQTKNMLFSVQGSSSTSTDAAPAQSSQLDKSFMGLKLTDDGKSLEFGGTSVSLSVSNVARREIAPPARISGTENENLDYQLQPSLTTNDFQVPPDAALPQNGQYQNQGSGDNNYTSNSFSCISQLVSSMERSTIHSPSLPVDPCKSHQHHPLPQDLCTTPGDVEAIQRPSIAANDCSIPLQQHTFLPHLDTPAYWNPSVPSSSQLLASNEQQPSFPPSGPPGNDYSVQYPTTTLNSILDDPPHIDSMPSSGNETAVHSSSILSALQQESNNNVPLLGTSQNDASAQEPLTTIQQIPQQESSIPLALEEILNSSWPDGNFSTLMNEPGSSCPHLYWDGDFDQDTFFRQFD